MPKLFRVFGLITTLSRKPKKIEFKVIDKLFSNQDAENIFQNFFDSPNSTGAVSIYRHPAEKKGDANESKSIISIGRNSAKGRVTISVNLD